MPGRQGPRGGFAVPDPGPQSPGGGGEDNRRGAGGVWRRGAADGSFLEVCEKRKQMEQLVAGGGCLDVLEGWGGEMCCGW